MAGAVGKAVVNFLEENHLTNLILNLLKPYPPISLKHICTSRNETNDTLQIQVSEIDNTDWDGDGRPAHTFHDITIETHQSRN